MKAQSSSDPLRISGDLQAVHMAPKSSFIHARDPFMTWRGGLQKGPPAPYIAYINLCHFSIATSARPGAAFPIIVSLPAYKPFPTSL